MLITQLKDKDTLAALVTGKAFIVNCLGCREVGFPEKEAKELEKELEKEGKVTGILTTDYICNPDNLKKRLESFGEELDAADCVLVFSCGVGVQTFARMFAGKRVYAACDTIRLPGVQGVTPLEYDCWECGECFLNLTGGICPVTACSKSLVNGPCGGTKDGMCEVDPEMECGWERIIRRLRELGRLDALHAPTQFHHFNTDEAVRKMQES